MRSDYYIIRGGKSGRDRLKILSRVLHPTTMNLFERLGISPGMKCLDVGCGSGDVSFDLAEIVGEDGYVKAIDIDSIKIELALNETARFIPSQLEFLHADFFELYDNDTYDVIYARFVLTHLPSPGSALKKLYELLAPGGILVVEDIDFDGHFCYPENASFSRYIELYTKTVQLRGGDPFIGKRLPAMLRSAGYAHADMNVVIPAGIAGEVKYIAALTMDNIKDAVVEAEYATLQESEAIVVDLNNFADDQGTIISLPRIVQTWGWKE